MAYDAFMSYSHAADGRLAPAVQTGLHRLARPWYKPRALRVFRDDTGLAVNPHLWAAITTAMESSSYFVLMASPEAAASPWVNREIEHWCETKSADHILPVLTDGTLMWDASRGDYDHHASSALPPALAGRFADEPRHLDLRWARDETELDLRHSRFREAVADLAAPMHGIAKEELESEDVRRYRRGVRLARVAVATVMAFALLAILAGFLALVSAHRANASASRATLAASREHVAKTDAQHQRDAATKAADGERSARGTAETAQRRAEDEAGKATAANTEATRQRDSAVASEGRATAEAENARRAELAQAKETDRATTEAAKAEAAAKAANQSATDAAIAALEAAHQRDVAKAASDEASRQRDEAVRQRNAALSRSLAASALNAIDEDRIDLGLLLAVEATRVEPNAQARHALLSGLLAQSTLSTVLHGNSLFGIPAVTAFSRDGHVVASIDLSGRVALWNADSHRLRPVQPKDKEGPFPEALAVSGDGTLLAASAGDAFPASIKIWDLATGEPLPTQPDARESMSALAFNNTGTLLASVGRGGIVRLWDARSGTLVRSLAAPNGDGEAALAFSADDRTLAMAAPETVTGSDDRVMIHRWDVGTGAMIGLPLEGQRARGLGSLRMVELSFDAAGRTLTAAADGARDNAVFTWDVASGTVLSTFGATTNGAIAAVSPDHQIIVTRDTSDGSMRLWRAADGTAIGSALRASLAPAPEGVALHTVAFRPDGHTLAAGVGVGTVRLWDAYGAPHLQEELPPQDAVPGPVILASDARTTATFDDNNQTIRVFDVGTGQLIAELLTPLDRSTLSPDLGVIARLEDDGRIGVRNVRTGLLVAPRLVPPSDCNPDHKLAVSPGGRVVVAQCSGVSSSLVFWNVASGQARRTPPIDQAAELYTSAFSADSRVFATRAFGAILSWDAKSAQPLPSLTRGRDPFASIALNVDGSTLAVGTAVDSDFFGTSQIELWDVRSGRPLTAPLPSQSGSISQLAFSPDGTTIVAVSDDVRLWDVASGQTLATVIGPHANRLFATAAFDSSTSLVSADSSLDERGTSGTTLIRWDLRPSTWVTKACDIANRNLTSLEWSQLFGTAEPFHDTCGTLDPKPRQGSARQ
jgi:WD40 repeat protein